MGTLAALVIATPLFGLSLSVSPDITPPDALAMQTIAATMVEEAPADGGPGDSASEAGPTIPQQMRERGRLAKLHKWLGIATWASMGVTLLLGGFQYHNLYGFFAGQEDNPCVSGGAIFGQGQCTGVPWPHLISSMLTTVLYSATFALSFRMPDPMNLSEGDSDYARNLRRHKRLRWVHFAGMIVQMGLGFIVANSERLGLDRANDYGTLQALGTVHMTVGLVTYAAMTWAGAIMAF